MAPKESMRTLWRRDVWVKPYLGRYRTTLALALSLGVATIAFAVGLMFTAGWLIGGSAEMPFSIFLLGTPLLCVRVFGVGKPVLQYFERLASHDWVLRMTSSLRRRLYRSLDQQGIFFRATWRVGDALGLLSEDIGHIQNLYLRTVFPAVIALVVGLALVAVFGTFSWQAALVALVLVLIELIAVPGISVCINGCRRERAKDLQARLYAEVTDDVLGVTDWILSGRAHDCRARHARTQDEVDEVARQAHAFDRARDLAQQIVFALGAVLVLCWAALSFGGGVGGDSNWILAFTLGYFPLADAFAPLPAAAVEARGHADSLARLNRLPDPDEHGKEGKQHGAVPAEPLRIELDEAAFSYPGSDARVLDGVTLALEPGEKVAVLGKSGSGKSTLVSLVRGDLSPTQGTVRAGGIDCDALGAAATRVFGVVQQDTYLFNATLRDNLRVGNADASDERLVQVLGEVGLSEVFARLESGLDTIVGEGGSRFSGGERHRIALARILIQDAPAVILDEPTVGLDPATEAAVLDTLFATLEGKTLIMVTHHLQGMRRFDRVVFLENGRIALDGAPEELERTSAFYRTLLACDDGAV